MLIHINHFYRQNSFHEGTGEKDSVELLLGSIKMRVYKKVCEHVCYSD